MLVCTVFTIFCLGIGFIQPVSADSIQIHYIGEGNVNNASNSNHIVISGNGERILTTMYLSTSTIKWATLWDVPDVPISTIPSIWNYTGGPYAYTYSCPAISDDGNTMIFILRSSPSQILCFNSSSAIPLWTYTATELAIDTAISGNGAYVVVGTRNSLTLLNRTGDVVWSWSSGSYVDSVCISNGGSVIAAGLANMTVVCFNRASNVPLWKTTVLDGWVSALEISTDGSTIVGGCLSGTINVAVFNAGTGSVLWKRDFAGTCNDASISSDGSRIFLAASSEPFCAAMFSRSSNTTLWTIPTTGSGDSCDLSQDSKVAICGDYDGNFYIVNGSSGQIFLNFTGPNGSRLQGCSISDNGLSLAVLSATGRFYVFRLAFSTPFVPAGDPLDLIQWILIGGLAAGLVIMVFITVKQGKGRKS